MLQTEADVGPHDEYEGVAPEDFPVSAGVEPEKRHDW